MPTLGSPTRSSTGDRNVNVQTAMPIAALERHAYLLIVL